MRGSFGSLLFRLSWLLNLPESAGGLQEDGLYACSGIASHERARLVGAVRVLLFCFDPCPEVEWALTPRCMSRMSAEELKSKGNAFFSAKQYQEAVGAFTEAIAVDPNNHVLFSNRSASYAGLEVCIFVSWRL